MQASTCDRPESYTSTTTFSTNILHSQFYVGYIYLAFIYFQPIILWLWRLTLLVNWTSCGRRETMVRYITTAVRRWCSPQDREKPSLQQRTKTCQHIDGQNYHCKCSTKEQTDVPLSEQSLLYFVHWSGFSCNVLFPFISVIQRK